MRRNLRAYFVCLFLAGLSCFFSAPVTAVPQALPDTVAHAHTVFLENETGFHELEYTLVLELAKWGRFDLVDTREKADLIIRLDSGSRVRVVPEGEFPSSNALSEVSVPKGYTRIALLDPKNDAMLWSDNHKTEGGKVKSGHLLDGLREAFESYEKSRR